MKLKHAAITTIVGALLMFPTGALADSGQGGGKTRSRLDVRVNADNSGRGSTDVDVRKTKIGSGDTRAVQITATPDENRPIGPLDISVNAQVAVVQVVLKTNDVAVLDDIDVDVTQAGAAGAGDPGASTPPPTGGGDTQSTAPGAGINISVNAQVAIVQVVVGTNNKVVLKNIDVNIAQGGQAA